MNFIELFKEQFYFIGCDISRDCIITYYYLGVLGGAVTNICISK